MSIEQKIAINVDPVRSVVTYQFLDVMSEAEVQQASDMINKALSFLPARTFVILEDYRALVSPDNPWQMKEWSKSGYEAFKQFRWDGHNKVGKKVGILAVAPDENGRRALSTLSRLYR